MQPMISNLNKRAGVKDRRGDPMTILLVDTDPEGLQGTAALLQKVVPNSFVIAMLDPLMAAKYAFTTQVDALLAKLDMKRMNGLQLCEFVKQKNPGARICLIGSPQEFCDCPELMDSSVQQLTLPVSVDALQHLFAA